MKHALIPMAAALLAFSTPAHAAAEPDYNPAKPRVTTPWYGVTGPAQKSADMDFITGMKPHHEGALSMSNEYLANPQAKNSVLKKLARGIIHNQEFEIMMLAQVKRHLDDLSFPYNNAIRAQIATGGLAQKHQFKRAPMPGPLDRFTGTKTVSAEDVRFAKAMIIHHEGALVMAQDYLGNPNATNGYLRLMCIDILRDQKMEIDMLKSIIRDYNGNPDDIIIDPSMVHGMDGMEHTGHHHPATTTTTAPTTAATAMPTPITHH